jgi:hypothetical protein
MVVNSPNLVTLTQKVQVVKAARGYDQKVFMGSSAPRL